MHIIKLSLSNFRNIQSASLSFSKGINALYGRNGQGKTNTLEAIMLALQGKSHRERKALAFIGPYSDSLSIEAEVASDSAQAYTAGLYISAEKRVHRVDGHTVKKRSEIAPLFPAIFFSPADLELVRGPAASRRAYLDESISVMSKNYAAALAEHRRLLSQKSSILRQYNRSLDSMLDIYDEKLAECGAIIIKSRIRFLRALKPELERQYHYLSGGREKLDIDYYDKAVIEIGSASLQESYLGMLERARKVDIRYRECTEGIHRDDIVFTLDKMQAQNFASLGQQKSLALCMKLSLINIYKNALGEKPVALLDDVLSELDSDRRKLALTIIAGSQAVITCTDESFLESRRDVNKFIVSEGIIKN
ncbi:MAG: DNA replication and repair protein RecF [Eubacteriaceae bacterium]|nr:DNA replication and repair protein RecF [Eubacteriaceae bacterium]